MQFAFSKAREPFSSFSHFVGAMLSGMGLLLMVIRLVLGHATTTMAFAAILFCLSLIALYSASSVYHFSMKSETILKRLKKLDHAMIYVLIAGSYTPIILRFMPAPRSYAFIGVIWGVALAGIAIKLLWIDAPRFLGTLLYLVLGWAIVVDFRAVLSMPAAAITLLAMGGLSYTIGGMIYIFKKPNLSKTLGFHELFHLFVVAGSVFHYLMVFWYVL